MLRTAKADAMQRVLAEVYGDSKPIRTTVDANRNALIISAPREELEEVEQLIQALDAEK
jgi:type II secretory pathway component GspD/PulD (secretin)